MLCLYYVCIVYNYGIVFRWHPVYAVVLLFNIRYFSSRLSIKKKRSSESQRPGLYLLDFQLIPTSGWYVKFPGGPSNVHDVIPNDSCHVLFD